MDVAAGLTGKIRSAETTLFGSSKQSKDNVGFVPLLNFHVAWQPGGSPFGVLFNVDALAAPQGRAEDVLLAGTWSPRDGVNFYAGYRTLEGGADATTVYTFAWFHYAVAGVQISL